jgi:hypothetical protein
MDRHEHNTSGTYALLDADTLTKISVPKSFPMHTVSFCRIKVVNMSIPLGIMQRLQLLRTMTVLQKAHPQNLSTV